MKKFICGIAALFTLSVQTNAQCWKQVSPGSLFTLAVKTDGSLWSWGYNNYGQLGIGNTTDKLWPVQVGAANDWMLVAAGNEYSFAIKTDGTLWAWGANYNGFLGLGYYSAAELLPIQVGTSSDWAYVYPGVGQHTLALKTDGTLWAWGYNGYGELGIGNNTNYNSPQQVGTATDWEIASAGYGHSLGIKTDSTLWAWGNNLDGQLGIGNNTNSNVPVQVGTATNWKSIAAGNLFTEAIKTDGTAWGWGRNFNGQLGTGNTTSTNIPVQEITLSTNWKTITTGQQITQALKSDNTLWAWGYGYNGDNFISTSTPEQAGTASNWDTVANMWNDGFGIQTGNTLWGWGENTFGAVGNGTTNPSLIDQVTCNIILPVTWLYVKGKLQNNSALIEWATATETNTKHFEIEHSSNGIAYSKIGNVAASGNSSITQRYEFLHSSTSIGNNYYRIKQIDLDGRFTYSAVVLLKNFTANNILISPNPVLHNTTVYFKESGIKCIRLLNSNGQIVMEQPVRQGSNNQTLNLSQMPAGMYLLQVQTENYMEVKKIFKQ